MGQAVLADISAKQAEKLWSLLRQHFQNFERTLEEIIAKRAWEPMGYASFAEAWTAQMSDVTLAPEFRPHVVYQMFADGCSDDEVAAGVKGVGPSRAAGWRREREHGVSAGAASRNPRPAPRAPGVDPDKTRVRAHDRKKAGAPDTIHLTFSPLRLKRFERIAKRHGLSVTDIASSAVQARFDELSEF